MKIKKISPSAYNTSNCQLAWFSEYQLGWRGLGSLATEKGSIVHAVLEDLAQIKLKGLPLQTDAGLLEEGYDVDKITAAHYKIFSEKTPHLEWTDKIKLECIKWVHKVLDYNNGQLDPRNLDIIDSEKYFSIEMPYEWALLEDGQYLKINGFIDLITRVNEKTYNIIDWKSGGRTNWKTYKPKTEQDFKEDIQLLIYYWAAHKLYPEVENFIVDIVYFNDGGDFPIFFERTDLEKAERLIKKRFESLKTTIIPRLNKTSSCLKICHQGKSTFENCGHIEPLVEFRDGQFTQPGHLMSKCQQLEYLLSTRGLEWVEQNMTKTEK